jgi:hypothetical protein
VTALATAAAIATAAGTRNRLVVLAAHSATNDEPMSSTSTSNSISQSIRSSIQPSSSSSSFGLKPRAALTSPTLRFEPDPASSSSRLSDRYAALWNNVGRSSNPIADQESRDFLERLRAAEQEGEENERRALEQAMQPQDACHARHAGILSAPLPEWARQSLKTSVLLVLTAVVFELDWGRLLGDLNQASSVVLSIAWLPLLWMRPGGRDSDSGGEGPALETLVVYLLAVLRPSFLVRVWNDVLLPHTIPTLRQMVIREGWSLLWKGLLLPVLPQLPKNSTGWAAVHVFVLQSIHRGTMKLFTSNIQRHVQSSFVKAGQKAVQLVQTAVLRYRA